MRFSAYLYSVNSVVWRVASILEPLPASAQDHQ